MTQEEINKKAEEFEYTDGRYGFKEGVKWHSKKSYTEEDMINFAFDTYCYISKLMEVPFNQISENKLHAIENLKQFKNK